VFDVKQFALGSAVILVFDAEGEDGDPAVVDDGGCARNESERGVKDRERSPGTCPSWNGVSTK
jgi:hypothetical protein